ncbi:MAG: SAM-dependent methyltransferase [Phycisphaerales bacterium]|nr:SAM-dependent methyltransferase [Phycisphaerales bacterium]
MTVNDEKDKVHDFWNRASCGEALLLASMDRDGYAGQAKARYELEPYIDDLARFGEAKGQMVLEIGVGLGADHQRFAEAGAALYGIDLTQLAVDHTMRRLEAFNLHSNLSRGDAENLSFPDGTFDIVYSWGVLHHSPNTRQAFDEVLRVLKPGGRAAIMIYSKWSLVGLMLWGRYALLRGRPFTKMATIYSRYLESPGTKAFTRHEAERLTRRFSSVRIWTVMSHGDLLASGAGQRHSGMILSLARRLWPRWLFRTLCPHAGLFMLIEAQKPS